MQVPPESMPPSWAEPIARRLKEGFGQKKVAQRVLARMGAAGIAEAKKHLDPLPMPLVWAERGLSLQAATDDLFRLELIDSPLVVDPELDPNDSDKLREVLAQAGILFAFDAEHDFVPPPHHALIVRAAKHSRGRFNPVHPRQYWRKEEDEDAGLIVEFAHAGELIRFSTEFMRDWYDVSAVLKGANLALETAGKPDRFFVWKEDEDQMVTVIFGPAGKMEEFCRLYALPLDKSYTDLTVAKPERLYSKEHDEMIEKVKDMLQKRALNPTPPPAPAAKPSRLGNYFARFLSWPSSWP